jgi:hypothetical protein
MKKHFFDAYVSGYRWSSLLPKMLFVVAASGSGE